VAAITAETIPFFLNRTALTDTQLQTLAEELQSEDPKSSLRIAIQGERCMGLSLFLGADELAGVSLADGPSSRLLGPLRAVGYLQRDAASYLDLMQALLDALALPTEQAMQVANTISTQETGGMFTRILTPALARIAQLAGRSEAQLRTAWTGLAVERYRLAQGTFPEDLQQLVPDYLEAVPLDPFDGQALRYRRMHPGYIVYSIGEDLSDDGGRERVRKSEGGRKGDPWDITFIVAREN
jgi:hypothetical protein